MEDHRFVAFRGVSFPGTRARANGIARAVTGRLEADPGAGAAIGMARVTGVSGSFGDELPTHRDEAFGSYVPERVRIVSARPDVAEMLRGMAGIFDLHLPRIEGAVDPKGPPAWRALSERW